MSESVEILVEEILKKLNEKESSAESQQLTKSDAGEATAADYPIAQKHPDWITVGQGKKFTDISLDSILSGEITAADLRIKPEILIKQGEIAKHAGRESIQYNFSRAAELTKVPDARVLEIYNALRPYRSSKQELLDIADELEHQYGALICAGFVREAAENYERRKKLKGDN
ncbi:diol dehydratase small subunit [Streptococcus panodentis]|uniref:Propanediol dehydratase n=1 Tax=Streptococcus panodentis TaxID=1581472 RepID=A0ABS5AXK3_9STRE|nr:diol dehydratase small subunit [Streptococcus panodentis]MBP2621314.1 propanediol dehydratase [Streptococcus panodentis]